MTGLEKQVKTAQHRLWLNRWFNRVSTCVLIAAGVYAFVVLIQRLWDFPIPLLWVGGGIAVVALLVSAVWTLAQREGAGVAAAVLDEAAGLRERVSSGLYCETSDDPFERAVVADAERISGAISVRQHVRFTFPRQVGPAGVVLVVAAAMFLITPGVLKRSEAAALSSQADQLKETRISVKKRLESVKQMVQTNPALKDLDDEFKAINKTPAGKLNKPGEIRHEAVKKIDKLADAVKKKRRDSKYDSVNEMRKMLRALQVPKQSTAPSQKLSKALAQGDFKTAKEEIKALKEQLATLKSKEDQELAEKLSKQLDSLAKQLDKLSKDDQVKKKLEQAGVKKEDIDRIVESLKKKDMDQVQKQLEKKGMNPAQAQKLAKQLQQRQQACGNCKQLSKAMQQGAKCNQPGQMGEAMAGMSQAQDQLSNLEQLEQEMNQLDSAMADLQDARDGLDKPCPNCNGTGTCDGKQCGKCKGSGGMGKRMRSGRGGLAPEEETPVGFKVQRGKVATTKGAIIGQFLVDGEQVKGDVSTEFVEIVSAAERDASDSVNRDRVPRQYQKSIKDYFSNVQRMLKDSKSETRKKRGKKSESTEKAGGSSEDGATSGDKTSETGKEQQTQGGESQSDSGKDE